LVADIAFAPDSQTLASASLDHTVRLWRISDGQQLWNKTGHIRGFEVRGVEGIAFAPNGEDLASAGDTYIKLWRADSGSSIRTLEGDALSMDEVVFSPDGQTIAGGSSGGSIWLWRESDGTRLYTLQKGNPSLQSVDSLIFDPSGQFLLASTGPWNHEVRMWNVNNGTLVRTVVALDKPITSIAVSPDSQILALGVGHNVSIYRMTDGALLQTLEGHSDYVNDVAFTPDGLILASAALDKTVKLWKVATGALLTTLTGHTDGVWCLAFSPDGLLLATGSVDKTIGLWGVR
jgi:WD40 repeat protein